MIAEEPFHYLGSNRSAECILLLLIAWLRSTLGFDFSPRGERWRVERRRVRRRSRVTEVFLRCSALGLARRVTPGCRVTGCRAHSPGNERSWQSSPWVVLGFRPVLRHVCRSDRGQRPPPNSATCQSTIWLRAGSISSRRGEEDCCLKVSTKRRWPLYLGSRSDKIGVGVVAVDCDEVRPKRLIRHAQMGRNVAIGDGFSCLGEIFQPVSAHS